MLNLSGSSTHSVVTRSPQELTGPIRHCLLLVWVSYLRDDVITQGGVVVPRIEQDTRTDDEQYLGAVSYTLEKAVPEKDIFCLSPASAWEHCNTSVD